MDANNKPADQAPNMVPSPVSGIIPPVANRFKPGVSGNPKGRPKAVGMTWKEHLNKIGEMFESGEIDRDDLKRIAKSDPNGNRAVAAIRFLHSLEYPDVADFDEFLEGKASIRELREEGVNTAVVKKVTQRSRVDEHGEMIVDRTIELHNRSGDDFDRVVNHTDGTPAGTVNINAEVHHKHTIDSDGFDEIVRKRMIARGGSN